MSVLLASLADLQAFMPGVALDDDQAEQLLGVASATIRREAGQVISLVADDSVVTDVDAYARAVWLSEHPVISVASVTIDGEVVPPESYRLDTELGRVLFDRQVGSWGTPTGFRPRATIVHTHGHDPIPDDLKGVCLSMTRRGIVADGPGAVVEETVGPDTIRYSSDLAAEILESERRTVRRYRIPVVA